MKKLFLAAALLALAVPAAMAKNDALSLVPNEAVTVGVVHLTDLRTSPLGATLFKETDKISTDGDAEKFLRDAGGTQFLGASALGRDVARIDPHATAWAVVDVQRAQRITGAPRMSTHTPQAQAVNSALRSVSTVALWATDNGDSLKLGAFGL